MIGYILGFLADIRALLIGLSGVALALMFFFKIISL